MTKQTEDNKILNDKVEDFSLDVMDYYKNNLNIPNHNEFFNNAWKSLGIYLDTSYSAYMFKLPNEHIWRSVINLVTKETYDYLIENISNEDIIKINYWRWNLNGYTYSIYWSVNKRKYCFSMITNPNNVDKLKYPIRKLINLSQLKSLFLETNNRLNRIQSFFKS